MELGHKTEECYKLGNVRDGRNGEIKEMGRSIFCLFGAGVCQALVKYLNSAISWVQLKAKSQREGMYKASKPLLLKINKFITIKKALTLRQT